MHYVWAKISKLVDLHIFLTCVCIFISASTPEQFFWNCFCQNSILDFNGQEESFICLISEFWFYMSVWLPRKQPGLFWLWLETVESDSLEAMKAFAGLLWRLRIFQTEFSWCKRCQQEIIRRTKMARKWGIWNNLGKNEAKVREKRLMR